MTQRKLCGYDINGWRDVVARNWSTQLGEEDEIGPTKFIVSGPLSSIVKVSGGERGRWIGGRQADAAPHGRGGGWGYVGKEDRRLTVRNLLGEQRDITCMAIPYGGYGKAAYYNVVAIDDTPTTNENFIKFLSSALSVARLRNPVLVWRSVLTVLHAVELGLLTAEQKIGVISQSPKGLSIQILHLRQADGHTGRILTPERRQAATVVAEQFGYADLVKRAQEIALGDDPRSSRTAHRAWARSVGHLALCLPHDMEVLLDSFRHWDFLDLSTHEPLPDPTLNYSLPPLEKCDTVLLETLSEGRVRDALAELVIRSHTGAFHILHATAVADGALIAAKRLLDGNPMELNS